MASLEFLNDAISCIERKTGVSIHLCAEQDEKPVLSESPKRRRRRDFCKLLRIHPEVCTRLSYNTLISTNSVGLSTMASSLCFAYRFEQ